MIARFEIRRPMNKTYSIRKSRRILKQGAAIYHKKAHALTEVERHEFGDSLAALDKAILTKDRVKANEHAQKVHAIIKKHFPKTPLDHLKELVIALAFAIVIAFAIRQVWFELYQVPTGSMRPTIEELDRLVVSKTTFGIKLPFIKNLLLYRPEYVQRMGGIVFTVEGMDVVDSDTTYFWIFPGKKRYVKRCMGKPGDTLYFYGGRIYAIDKEGNPVKELTDEAYLKEIGLEKIHHVPYITMEGKIALQDKISQGIYATALFNQWDIPVGRLSLERGRKIKGEFFNGKEWVKDDPAALKAPHDMPQSYSDLWGIGNYAMARLLTADMIWQIYHEDPKTKAPLYLELRHTPNLTYPPPELRSNELGRTSPEITPFYSLIPLNESHLKKIQEAMITARFRVKDGHAFRYQDGHGRPQHPQFDVRLPNVKDGCYELYYGKGYKVHTFGIMTELPKNSPLYNSEPDFIQKLFNLGVGFNLLFRPTAPNQPFNPQRFAYYNNGDLYLMGAPILEKDDPVLKAFIESELHKQKASSESAPYIAFVDHGPPLKDGSFDIEFIRNFGLNVPKGGIAALGDNYAMSADSRDFGFTPEMNLRGAPSWTFWPPSKRVGIFPQPPNPWFTLPNCLIWGSVILIVVVCTLYIRSENKKEKFKR